MIIEFRGDQARAEVARLRDLIETMVWRVDHDLDWETSETAPPADEQWVRILDRLRVDIANLAELAEPIDPAETAPLANPAAGLVHARNVEELTTDEAAAMLDRQARKLLGMSGQDFTERYRAGSLPADAPHGAVVRLAMMISDDALEASSEGTTP